MQTVFQLNDKKVEKTHSGDLLDWSQLEEEGESQDDPEFSGMS